MSAALKLDVFTPKWTSKKLSWQDYIVREAQSQVRHEFVNGDIYAMAGASRNHNRIAGNVFAELHRQLEGKPCEPFMADMKLHIQQGQDEVGYYPDVIVSCDPRDNDRHFVENPSVIFEVLSSSTHRIDTREKLLAYQSVPGLQVYVMLHQDRIRAVVHRRSNQWWPEILEDGNAILTLDEINVQIPLARIYQRVVWTESEDAEA